jgi:hypothetical protein
MPQRPRRCRAPPRHEQPRRRRAARRIVVEPAAHTAHASGNEPQPLARYGQNDRAIALNRKNALFAGHDGGAENWAGLASPVETCKPNGLDPHACLTDAPTKLVNLWPAARIDELMTWAWTGSQSNIGPAT